jgi:hypothetical protein
MWWVLQEDRVPWTYGSLSFAARPRGTATAPDIGPESTSGALDWIVRLLYKGVCTLLVGLRGPARGGREHKTVVN